MATRDWRQEWQQVVVLARTFFVRFFENETTGGRMELHSVVSLVAGLATLGAGIPVMAANRWSVIAATRAPEGGPEFLRLVSVGDTVFVLGYTMVIAGLLGVFLWSSLLIDRRDVLILKAFPVRDRTLVAGKWCALGILFLIVCVGMNVLNALLYGLLLGAPAGPVAAARLIGAHVIVASAAGLCAFLTVIATQGLLLAVAGPRRAMRLVPMLQLVLIAALIALFAATWIAAASAATTIYGIHVTDGSTMAEARSWTFLVPPVWFLGVYESLHGGLQGTSISTMHALGARAELALLGVISLVLVSYPLAYRRVVNGALVGFPRSGGFRLTSSVLKYLPQLLTRDSVGQATIQFATATFGRAGFHRLAIGTAVNIGLAISVSIVAVDAGATFPRPTVGLLDISIILMIAVLVGLRVAMTFPVELPAAWLFVVSAGHGWRAHRTAMRRLLWLCVSLVPLVALPFYWAMWGGRIAIEHGLVCLSLGAFLTELALSGIHGVPSTREQPPGRARLQSGWPFYVLLTVFMVVVLPAVETAFFRSHARAGVPGIAVIPGIVVLFVVAATFTKFCVEQQLPDPSRVEVPSGGVSDVVLHLLR